MKLSSPSLRRTMALSSCLVALAWLAAACGSDDKTTTPPNNPPPPDAGNPDPVPDVQTPPPPEMDAG
ncbi:MAG TPA: hypothetical protein VK550_25530, partial [Polyangiaceae bacterium]|nr:hypothetical protein [Polyangiaceae bacterium]